jgi:hypothetical protein
MPTKSFVSRKLSLAVWCVSAVVVLVLSIVEPALAVSPVPLINQPLVPTSTTPGGAGFTLTVNGSGFVAASTVNWNGTPRVTTFVSSSQLKAAILASDISASATAAVTVVTPGGGNSNPVYFPVASPFSVFTLTRNDYFAGLNNFTSGTAVADLNGDGKVDAVTGYSLSPHGVLAFLNNGDGTLQAPISSLGACEVQSLATGDFNGDGKVDLVIADPGGSLCIMLGNGDGTFQPGTAYSAGFEVMPTGLTVGDFNGDGHLDAAVGHELGDGNISVLLGNGDGSFQAPSVYSSGFSFPNSPYVTTGDFNRDGKLDLIVAGSGVSVLLGNGDGTFQPATVFAFSGSWFWLVAADFNGDGNLDLAASGEASSVGVFLGNGNGTFQPEVDYALQFGSTCSGIGDLNHDGTLDLGCFGDPDISIFFGNGDGSFQSALAFPGAGAEPEMADMNGDGQLDIVGAATQYMSVFLQTTVQRSPASLTFASQPIGTNSKPQMTTVTNDGSAVLNISGITLTGSNPGDFKQKNNCGSSLAVGASCTVSVVFKPTAAFTRTANVAISDDATGSPQTVTLTGTGDEVGLSPKSLFFGSVMVGQKSAPQIITVKNVGAGSLDVSLIGVSGTDKRDYSATNNCPKTLLAGATCQVTVTFAPLRTGKLSADVTLEFSGLTNQMVPLGGMGI